MIVLEIFNLNRVALIAHKEIEDMFWEAKNKAAAAKFLYLDEKLPVREILKSLLAVRCLMCFLNVNYFLDSIPISCRNVFPE